MDDSRDSPSLFAAKILVMKGQYIFFVTLRILQRSIVITIHQIDINGAQILSCSNDHRLKSLANEANDVTWSFKPEKGCN